MFMLCSCFPISKIQIVLFNVSMAPVRCPFTKFLFHAVNWISFSFHPSIFNLPFSLLLYLFCSICISRVIADIVALVPLFDYVACGNGGSAMNVFVFVVAIF